MLTETKHVETRKPDPAVHFHAPAHVNEHVKRWVKESVELCTPDKVVWCSGSKAERDALIDQAVKEGVLLKLNEQRLPGCYYHRSNPNDVAR
ncbi:MAG: hypothetical protein ABIP55_06670, partial [Tepidisphaeraceae bacterium]